jgi:hypothetical protein
MREPVVDHSRRRVLCGAGGFTLALPFLPSLASRAFCAEAIPKRDKYFVSMGTAHGGIWGANMYPAQNTLNTKMPLFPGHEISRGPLKRVIEGADAYLSPVLRSTSVRLTDRIVSKMNVLRGFDIPWYIAHNTGGFLGNFADCLGSGGNTNPMPTIDQVMAWSPAFYRSTNGIKVRSMVVGQKTGFNAHSWSYSNPTEKSGKIQALDVEGSSLAMFNKIFVPAGTPVPLQRKPIVDRVIENYRLLRNSNRRLSAQDKRRLDDHMSRLSEVQRAVNDTTPRSCGNVSKPNADSSNANSKTRYGLFNDVIAAAFACGTSRIAIVNIGDNFSNYGGSWHQDIAHQWGTPGPQQTLTEALRATFDATFLDLALKLDVPDATGVTYLDNTLMHWTQESGQGTHDNMSMPVVTAGSAAGYLNTGLYCDYRNQTKFSDFPYDKEGGPTFQGLLYRQWLATLLQAMGLTPSEYERAGVKGYADPFVDGGWAKRYVPGVLEAAGDVVPFVKV